MTVKALAVTISSRAASGVYEDRSGPVLSVKERTAQAIETTSAMFNAWRSETWKQ